jgi:hypothetical protein
LHFIWEEMSHSHLRGHRLDDLQNWTYKIGALIFQITCETWAFKILVIALRFQFFFNGIETFVKPQITPPVHRNQISEPVENIVIFKKFD